MHLFSSDIDWAPEAVIADTIELFNRYNVKCTFFCTHPSEVIDSIKSDKNFELGAHPNFLPVMNTGKGSLEKTLEDILAIVPDAKGVRSHSLVQSSRLSILFKEFNLQYQANTHLPYKAEIAPYRLWNGLLEVMHNFEDDIHFLYNNSFDDSKLQLYTEQLNVFSFHPVHIYLNTDSEQTFINAREHYKDAPALLKLRNKKKTGARDLLIKLLENHRANYTESYTIYEYLQKINLV